MVCDLVLELVVQRELPVVDQLLDVLGEVVDVLPDFCVVLAEVGGYGLVASGAGHDHVLGSHAVRFLDNGLGTTKGLADGTRPEQRRGAAPLLVPEAVHLDAGASQDDDSGLGDVLHPVGSGAPGEEDDVRRVAPLDLRRPPGIPLGGGLAVGVVDLFDLGRHALVGGEGSGAVLDDPGPHVLPEVHQADLGVAHDLAVAAAGALVHGVDELGAQGDLPAHQAVKGAGSGLVELVDVVDLTAGGDGLPGGLVVRLADVDAVSALQAGCQDLLYAGELDELRFLDFDLDHDSVLLERPPTGRVFQCSDQKLRVFNGYRVSPPSRGGSPSD